MSKEEKNHHEIIVSGREQFSCTFTSVSSTNGKSPRKNGLVLIVALLVHYAYILAYYFDVHDTTMT